MDISVSKTNSTRRSGMDMPVSCLIDSLLFVHAATGCDTTSAVYRKGKRVPFRKTASATSIVYGGASLQ